MLTPHQQARNSHLKKKKVFLYLFNVSLSQLDKWIKMHWDSFVLALLLTKKRLIVLENKDKQ